VPSNDPDARRVPVPVPPLGAGDQEILLNQWLVDPGAPVSEGDRVAEVLVAGIVFHIAATADGTLDGIEVGSRHKVAEGDVLAWIVPDSAEGVV